ncbi:hypothetical protein FD754_011483 [Muntiacus muntjak]|uniref:Ig-like domain-containing protein n=1 Tax=Muntiacus muntjak TaxID=9888 RepID=A0A5N3VEC3_MUNMU|nr:hypothetical protein FD754_011483 [Muntiacus muntjak]
MKVLHSICQQMCKTRQWPQDWKRSVFIPIPKKGNTKECSKYCTIALISHASKVMLKILQARLQQYMNCELPDERNTSRLILSLSLFNLYAEYIMRNAGLDEAQAGIKIAGRNINSFRYRETWRAAVQGVAKIRAPAASNSVVQVREPRAQAVTQIYRVGTRLGRPAPNLSCLPWRYFCLPHSPKMGFEKILEMANHLLSKEKSLLLPLYLPSFHFSSSFYSFNRRLEQNFFNCSCDIRWMQLWQEQGEAKLNSQNLYCIGADGSQLPLFRMNISQCDLPEISVSHANLTVREGDNAVITCNGSGSPLPDVDWIVTGLQSINTHQTNLNWTNVHAINLTLVNVTSEDNGFTLTCIAENVVGMSNASVALTVHYPPRVVSLEEPELRLEHCIEFVVRGNPPPTLHWLHNGQPLRESKIIHVEYYQEGEVSEGCLLFNKPTHYNNGNYTLIAKNPLGTANQTINGHFLKEPFPESTDNFVSFYEVSPTPPITVTHKPEEDTFGVSIAVGLAAFACVLLVVLFIMINKYGRRSKFGMKGKGPMQGILAPSSIQSSRNDANSIMIAKSADRKQEEPMIRYLGWRHFICQYPMYLCVTDVCKDACVCHFLLFFVYKPFQVLFILLPGRAALSRLNHALLCPAQYLVKIVFFCPNLRTLSLFLSDIICPVRPGVTCHRNL